MPNEDTATPETKLTAMCERTIQQLDELSEKLDAYCRELESRVRPARPRWRCNAHHRAVGAENPATGARGFLSGFTQVLGCDHGHSGRM